MNIALQAGAKSGEARPGRSCPLHYRYGPGVFRRPQDFDARTLYGIELEGVHVDAVPVRYNAGQWIEQFDRAWPPGSAAAQSYRGRIAHGPAYAIDQAVRGSVILGLQPGQG